MVFIKKIIYSFLFWLVFATKTGYDKGFLSRKLTTCQASSLRVGVAVSYSLGSHI